MRDPFDISKKEIEMLREKYPAGARVSLVRMEDPYRKLDPGEEGTVTAVDDIGTIHVNWDCGSSLGVAYKEDQCKSLVPEFTGSVRDGIMFIRETGVINMFDAKGVEKLARELDYEKTANFIRDHRENYSEFILSGHV